MINLKFPVVSHRSIYCPDLWPHIVRDKNRLPPNGGNDQRKLQT
jgi:hypothetical protein